MIFAPYETYLDDLLGVKTSYGASVLIRNEEESRKLAVYQKYVPDMQDALPLDAADRPSKRGHLTPMEVMDAPYRARRSAARLPGCRRQSAQRSAIHQEKGTKKIFFKNFMDARVNYVILPIARNVDACRRRRRKRPAKAIWPARLLHEICARPGPAFCAPRTASRSTSAKRSVRVLGTRRSQGGRGGHVRSGMADGPGRAAARTRAEEYYASYVAGIFRTLRFGTGEAHGRAEMMEFNYLLESRALSHMGGRYTIDFAPLVPRWPN